jgi:hypothetical protein
MNTPTGGFGPAGITSDTIFDGFAAQLNGFDFGTGILHAFNQGSKHQVGLALPLCPGAGIKR